MLWFLLLLTILFSYVINTVETAAAGSGSWLTNSGLVRTTKATGNTLLAGGGLCYNVRSASNVLLDLLEDTLGRAGEMYRQAARLLIINDNYINREAYYKTAQQYSGYGGDEAYGSSIRKAFIYDLLTDGNAATLQLVNSWFDAEGNFIAFPGVFRTYLIYHATAIKDF